MAGEFGRSFSQAFGNVNSVFARLDANKRFEETLKFKKDQAKEQRKQFASKVIRDNFQTIDNFVKAGDNFNAMESAKNLSKILGVEVPEATVKAIVKNKALRQELMKEAAEGNITQARFTQLLNMKGLSEASSKAVIKERGRQEAQARTVAFTQGVLPGRSAEKGGEQGPARTLASPTEAAGVAVAAGIDPEKGAQFVSTLRKAEGAEKRERISLLETRAQGLVKELARLTGTGDLQQLMNFRNNPNAIAKMAPAAQRVADQLRAVDEELAQLLGIGGGVSRETPQAAAAPAAPVTPQTGKASASVQIEGQPGVTPSARRRGVVPPPTVTLDSTEGPSARQIQGKPQLLSRKDARVFVQETVKFLESRTGAAARAKGLPSLTVDQLLRLEEAVKKRDIPGREKRRVLAKIRTKINQLIGRSRARGTK